MHCVAGDGVGILAGAVLSTILGLAGITEVIVEYALGFGLGWVIFQSLFMRDMAGGSYRKALTSTFLPELLSMNLLMAGMVPTVMALREHVASANNSVSPRFWFVMSMGLLVGFVITYPMNWWLVANHLKHGMMTVRPAGVPAGGSSYGHDSQSAMSDRPHEGHQISMGPGQTSRPPISVMTLLSFFALAAGVAIAFVP
jgi:hypothetical protein